MRCAALLLAGFLLLSGCASKPTGSSSGTSSPGSGTTSPSASATTTTGTTATNTTTSAAPPAPRTYTVNLTGNQFQPASLSIRAGDTVHWVDKDTVPHTVTDDGGAFDEPMTSGKTFDRKYTSAGSFPYHCKIHSSMVGTVTVT